MSPHLSPERPTGGCQTARVLALPYSDRELRDIAEGYLRHEIVTLCGQVRELREWNATGSLLAPVHDALLEAPLLHFLVLDDFLGTGPVIARGDVGAQHYFPGRSLAPVLTRQEREELEAQLQLGRPRRPLQDWDHDDITARLCEAFIGFTQSLDRHPEPAVRRRGEWFVEASVVAHAFDLEVRTDTLVISVRDEDQPSRSEPLSGSR